MLLYLIRENCKRRCGVILAYKTTKKFLLKVPEKIELPEDGANDQQHYLINREYDPNAQGPIQKCIHGIGTHFKIL